MADTLEYTLRLNRQGFSGPMGQVVGEMRKLNESVGKLQSSAGGATRAVSSLSGGVKALGVTVAAAAAPLLAVVASLKTLGAASSAAANMEDLAVEFTVFLGSAEKAAKVMEDLKRFSDQTPFEPGPVMQAGKALIPVVKQTQDLIPLLTRLGDVASGTGQNIDEFVRMYIKMGATGKLETVDMDMLADRIPAFYQKMGDMIGKTAGETRKLAGEGKVTFPLLEQLIVNLTSKGGIFYQMMAAKSATFTGLLSTLKGRVDGLLAAFGAPINDSLKTVLRDAANLADQLKPLVVEIGGWIGAAVTAMRNFVARAHEGGGVVKELGKALKKAFSGLVEVALIPVRAMLAAMPALGAAMRAALEPVATWLGSTLLEHAYRFAATMVDALGEAMQGMPLMGRAGTDLRTKAIEIGDKGLSHMEKAFRALGRVDDGMSKSAEMLAKAVEDFKEGAVDAARKIVPSFGRKPAAGQPQGGADGEAGGKAGPVKGLADAIATAAGAKKTKDADSSGAAIVAQEFAILHARATGETKLAETLQRQLDLGREAQRIAEATGQSEKFAMKMAEAKRKLEDQLGQRMERLRARGFDPETGRRMSDGRRRITGAVPTGIAAPSGLARLTAMQAARAAGQRLGGLTAPRGPQGTTPPGVATRRQRQAEAAQAAATQAQPRWDLVEAIERRLASLGIA